MRGPKYRTVVWIDWPGKSVEFDHTHSLVVSKDSPLTTKRALTPDVDPEYIVLHVAQRLDQLLVARKRHQIALLICKTSCEVKNVFKAGQVKILSVKTNTICVCELLQFQCETMGDKTWTWQSPVLISQLKIRGVANCAAETLSGRKKQGVSLPYLSKTSRHS